MKAKSKMYIFLIVFLLYILSVLLFSCEKNNKSIDDLINNGYKQSPEKLTPYNSSAYQTDLLLLRETKELPIDIFAHIGGTENTEGVMIVQQLNELTRNIKSQLPS